MRKNQEKRRKKKPIEVNESESSIRTDQYGGLDPLLVELSDALSIRASV